MAKFDFMSNLTSRKIPEISSVKEEKFRETKLNLPNIQTLHFSKNVFQILKFTVCVYEDFCIIQILREINFWETTWKFQNYLFSILGALNCVNLVNFSIHKVQKYMKVKIQSL